MCCQKSHMCMATVKSWSLNISRGVAPNIVIVALGGTHTPLGMAASSVRPEDHRWPLPEGYSLDAS